MIGRQGNLVVRAPKRAEIMQIERFIQDKHKWIEKHQARVLGRARLQKKQYIDGERFLFLGQERVLRLVDGFGLKLVFDTGEFLLPRFSRHKAKSLFENWYRGQAKYLLPRRAAFFAQKMGVAYKKISITGANTRWGSCSGRGTINFSWRLIMAPLEIIDYVVVHELAHLQHHNHSKKFWLLVGEYAPSWRQAKKWLNSQGGLLVLQ